MRAKDPTATWTPMMAARGGISLKDATLRSSTAGPPLVVIYCLADDPRGSTSLNHEPGAALGSSCVESGVPSMDGTAAPEKPRSLDEK